MHQKIITAVTTGAALTLAALTLTAPAQAANSSHPRVVVDITAPGCKQVLVPIQTRSVNMTGKRINKTRKAKSQNVGFNLMESRTMCPDKNGMLVDVEKLSARPWLPTSDPTKAEFRNQGFSEHQYLWYQEYRSKGLSIEKSLFSAASAPSKTPAQLRAEIAASDARLAELKATESARRMAASEVWWATREAAFEYARSHGFNMYNCLTNPDGFTAAEAAQLDALFPGWNQIFSR
jgi:hypothetical protein